MSNLGLERALADIEIPFVRAAVGDRYVLSEMQSRGWQLGGESSGHILCLAHTSTGDGVVAALQVIAAMQVAGESLHSLKKGMTKYPQRMINVQCPREVVEEKPVIHAVEMTEQKLNGKGRVLLRPSGTEPVVRVMVEGEDLTLVEELARDLASLLEKAAS